MRKTIGSFAVTMLMVVALAAPVSAATSRGNAPDNFFGKLKNFIVRALDEAKIIWPSG
jgi:hypothetical protein